MADIKPVNLVFELNGAGAGAEVIALVLGQNDDLFKFYVQIEHKKPNTVSKVWVKSIMADESQQEMKGIIKIENGASGSDSYLSHRTLLLSHQAKSKTTPLLEIDEDDVKAGHAATTSKIDPEQLFYLRSRGLSEPEAKKTIIKGFVQELVEKIKDKKIKAKVEGLIEKSNAI